jgi:signal peptidase II
VQYFLQDRIPIIGDFAGLQISLNNGVAFGIELGFLQPVLISIALLIVCWMALSQQHTSSTQLAYGFIVGGGFANVFDRLIDGQVTDVFQVGSFPIFNVADSGITIGVALLLVDVVLKRRNG